MHHGHFLLSVLLLDVFNFLMNLLLEPLLILQELVKVSLIRTLMRHELWMEGAAFEVLILVFI